MLNFKLPSFTRDASNYIPLVVSHSAPDNYEPMSEDARKREEERGVDAAGKLPFSLLLTALLVASASILNVALIPTTLSLRTASESQLSSLPYPDKRLGLSRAAEVLAALEPIYEYKWPEKIVRLSQKLKSAVYGASSQVYITVEDSTFMKFPIPSNGGDNCLVVWNPPPASSGRKNDLTLKGDVSEVEVWSVVAPNVHGSTMSLADLDFDTLSWNTRPVQGELLGTLDIKEEPNSTTVEFACPKGEDFLIVEMRCLRVDCHVSFLQEDNKAPKLGFELARRL